MLPRMMQSFSHNTAPTQFIEAGGSRFAYRRFGNPLGLPILFLQHFRGNMDNFDPAITDALARDWNVVLFDNRGVGSSNGSARQTVDEIAGDAALFADALGLRSAIVLGHSMGGEVAQVLALRRPELVARLILAGTGPRGGEGMAQGKPSTAELFAKTYERQDEMWIPIMFSPSAKSAAAGWKWLERIRARADRDAPVSAETATAHRAAASAWGHAAPNDYIEPKGIRAPTLIVNGSNDIVIATVNSFILQQAIPNAKLVLYPDSGHGAHFEYHEDFVAQVRLFLSESGA
jgi:pimeloyl-ACP methyl ester carboxylesterase